MSLINEHSDWLALLRNLLLDLKNRGVFCWNQRDNSFPFVIIICKTLCRWLKF